MKTYFTILVCLIANAIVAQTTFDKTYANPIGRSCYDIIAADSSQWIIAGRDEILDSVFGYTWQRDFLMKIDSVGNIIWDKTLEYHEMTTNQRIVKTNNGYMISGIEGLCDVIGTYVTRLTENGDSVWRKSDTAQEYAPTAAGEVVMINGNYNLERLDTLGNSKWERPNVSGSKLTTLANGRAVFVTNKVLHLLDALDNPNLTYTLPNNPSLIETFGDSIFVVIGKKIYAFDDTLQLAYNMDFGAQVTEIIDFTKNANGWQVLDKVADEVMLKVFNRNGILAYSHLLGEFRFDLPRLALSDDRIGVTGNMFYHGSFVPFFQSFDQQTPPNIPVLHDVAVVDVTFDLFSQTFFCGPPTLNSLNWQNIEVLVKNNGTTTLDSFTLITIKTGACGSFCNYHAPKNQTFAGLNLAPNDSIWLSFGEYFSNDFIKNSYELCIWATSPNSHLDADVSNNVVCETRIPTATQDQATRAIQNIFPNPATDQIRIELGETQTVQNATVFNLLGQVVAQRTFGETAHFIDLSVAELRPAFYVVMLETETGRFVGKFLKE